MKLQSEINENGYILIEKLLNENELEYGLSSIKDNKVDYTITKKFIDNILLKKIKEKTEFMSNPIYGKFRLSNNNNSTDASTFHGDIYNKTKSEILPIYTCLCYFDETQMEVIPGSHKYDNPGCSIESYNNKKTIDIKRGDILIIHSNVHHRGIKYNNKNRRVLQVFEVFPDKETYDNHLSKLVVVKTSESFTVKNFTNPFMYQVSKYPVIINTITIIHYILIYNDLLYKLSLMDLPPNEKKDRYVSYEAGESMDFKDVSEKEKLNVNILCDTNIRYVPYSSYYLYRFIFLLILLIFIILYIKKFYKIPKKYKERISKIKK